MIADTIAPNVTYSVWTSNPNNAYGKAGDVISIAMNTTEGTTVPSVTCNNITFSVYGSAFGTSFSANHTVVNGDLNGVVVCTFVFSDAAGNPGSAYQHQITSIPVKIGDIIISIRF